MPYAEFIYSIQFTVIWPQKRDSNPEPSDPNAKNRNETFYMCLLYVFHPIGESEYSCAYIETNFLMNIEPVR